MRSGFPVAAQADYSENSLIAKTVLTISAVAKHYFSVILIRLPIVILIAQMICQFYQSSSKVHQKRMRNRSRLPQMTLKKNKLLKVIVYCFLLI